MPRRKKIQKKKIGGVVFYRTAVSVFLAIFIVAFFVFQRARSAAPLLANYYLGTLPTDSESIKKLSKNDLLILSPEQAIVRKNVIDQIKHDNPDIILLAYVPSQSYNMAWTQYPANTLFGDFQVDNNCWLRDSAGKTVSNWPGLKNTNMNYGCTDYLMNFVKTKILSAGIWDGIFWDMVNDGISGVNGGDIDLNGDGQKDAASIADAEWVKRIDYLLQRSQQLNVKYIVMNGSSMPSMQEYVNGRMYENFPTPWEKGGSWSAIMNGLEVNRESNAQPYIYIFNANTNNTGKSDDYRQMRFGLASSLMVNNVYFSFDYGDRNHAQAWSYDEYNVNLGDPTGPASAASGSSDSFHDDVWRRDYAHGVAMVNVTSQSQTVDLGGEYEKITGKQDPDVNDGSIVNSVTLGAKDGLIMLKTFQTTDNLVFSNGNFLRFYDMSGNRSRNGFFSFEDGLPGGAKIFNGDLDGDGLTEKIVAVGARLKIYNSRGEIWFDGFPLGGDYKGALNIAVGKLGPKEDSIVVSGDSGGKVVLYTYYGAILEDNFYPLGKKYKNGFTVAIGNVSGGQGDIIIGTAEKQPEVIVYDDNMSKIEKSFYVENKNFTGDMRLAAGDINGDGVSEILTVLNSRKNSLVKIFNFTGKNISQFSVPSSFGNTKLDIGALDVNFDGIDEAVLMNGE